ncbi:MAG: LamG domain-containing protein [Deltaproteobacteria bacterium]|nr:LamG domain-containing protein [Deltaproteobacteria bacterium]
MVGIQTVWIWLVVLVGCGFEATPTEDEMETDTQEPPGTEEPAIERTCTRGDASLELCIDFEDMTTLAGDGSGNGHDPVRDDALTTTTRNSELAVQMSALSRLQIAEHPDLDITNNLTVSMWIKADRLPAWGDAYWLLDNNRQYAMSLLSYGGIRCGLGGETIDTGPLIGPGWHHVACTYDGDQLVVYVDGSVAGCDEVEGPIATDGTEGLAIGANIGVGPVFTQNFVGALDNIQVFSRTWSSTELCSASGAAGCHSSCPGWGWNGD